MSLLRPCKTSAAFEAIPKSDLGLDLDAVEGKLTAQGWETVVNARVILVVRREIEASIFPSGKVVLKTDDRPTAERAWSAVELVIDSDGRS